MINIFNTGGVSGITLPENSIQNFTLNIDNFSFANLTSTEMQKKIANKEILFIWYFDDPYCEFKDNCFTSKDLTASHTYSKTGFYYVRCFLQYQDHKFEIFKKILIGCPIINNSGTITITKYNKTDNIYYTIDGSDPITNGILYITPFSATTGTLIKGVYKSYYNEYYQTFSLGI